MIASLKLGKTSAFQLLKRLNSYTKQNPLYKALKEFGKIIRSCFILKYLDDVSLRQSVEKQLSHIEMMNRFAKAIFFGQNQEFQVATKDTFEYIEGWYNRKRRHSALGNRSPEQFQTYLEQERMAA